MRAMRARMAAKRDGMAMVNPVVKVISGMRRRVSKRGF
jgi:hypothetical protein